LAEQTPGDVALDEQTVAAFAAHLEAFSLTLAERERQLLAALLLSAMDPLDRMRLRAPEDLLSPMETAVLRALEDVPEDA
jgi:hypothetical protein